MGTTNSFKDYLQEVWSKWSLLIFFYFTHHKSDGTNICERLRKNVWVSENWGGLYFYLIPSLVDFCDFWVEWIAVNVNAVCHLRDFLFRDDIARF